MTVVTQGNEVFIYVGSNDENIYCYTAEAAQPMATLSGHHATVCALGSSAKGILISGSWDMTARVWHSKDDASVLAGHEAAVWAVTFVGDQPLTASADKSIRLWSSSGDTVQKFLGHTDVVRGLIVFNNETFASCANDATVRIWNINGECLNILHGHDNYIYSISLLPITDPAKREFVTCSEDRTVKYWVNDIDVQTIRIPASTIWAVAALDDQNIAAAASNGTVYVFTCDPSRLASDADQAELEKAVSESQIPLSDLGDIKVESLPGPEVLMAEGARDGQTKIVRDGKDITCYQWSAIRMEWIRVGAVVGAGGQTKDPSSKEEYEGKMYDFVFNVDIEDGKPPLKLPYNTGDNPYAIAQA